MKVSLNTIKRFIDFELPPVDELVARINAQLGGVEEVVDLSNKYKDVVIVKVISCEKHPDADRLSVCVIDDGSVVKDVERDANGHVQVVCGAPNAREGIFAAWLPPKSTVPASYDGDVQFVLDAREIRSVKSNGMLAAADELALGSDHEGIIEIDPSEWKLSDFSIEPGASFAKAFGLDDTVIDIENKMFTHRPDCFGQLGVAREIAGILGHKFTSPDWYLNASDFGVGEGLELKVFNEAGEKCPRFMAVALRDVEVKPSPLWLQIELVRLGSKPINNIVDATNYVMLLTAQPTHAYDYDKLRGAALGVRMAGAGETCSLLNGKSYELTEDDIVIVDGEGVVGLAGVMGGGNSEVSETTKNIVLEVANFDMYSVRKTSMHYGLFTDAVTRFSKGQSALQIGAVMGMLMSSIADVAGGKQASPVYGQDTNAQLNQPITTTIGFINDRLGLSLESATIASILGAVEFMVKVSGETLMVTPPFWRTDIELAEDIVEEVGRLYGFDKLPRELPRRSIAPAPLNPIFAMKSRVRAVLKAAGSNEVLTYSFAHENLLKRAGQDPAQAFRLGNALSPDLQYYRLSLVPSLLAHIHPNIKAGHDEFALFEFGKAHRKDDMDDEGLPCEYPRLGFVYGAKKGEGAAYYTARRYVELIVPGLACQPLESFDTTKYPIFAQLAAPFDLGRSAVLMNGEKFVGVIGEFKQSVKHAFKLPAQAAGFELFQSHLLTVRPAAYVPLSKYPSVTQDISLQVPADTSYTAVLSLAERVVVDVQPGEYDSRVEPLSIYQRAGDKEHKTVTLRLSIASYEKTLTDNDVNTIMDAVAKRASEEVNARRI